MSHSVLEKTSSLVNNKQEKRIFLSSAVPNSDQMSASLPHHVHRHRLHLSLPPHKLFGVLA